MNKQQRPQLLTRAEIEELIAAHRSAAIRKASAGLSKDAKFHENRVEILSTALRKNIKLYLCRGNCTTNGGKIMKYIITTIIGLLACVSVPAQTLHEDNALVITNAYWRFLERAPDAPGHAFWTYQIDRFSKSDTEQAFIDSQEYQAMPKHRSQCLADYTLSDNFRSVRYAKPIDRAIITGAFLERNLVGTEQDYGVGFYGNTLKLQTDQCIYTLWFDWIALGVAETNALTSTISQSKSVTVTFDPISGVASKVDPHF